MPKQQRAGYDKLNSSLNLPRAEPGQVGRAVTQLGNQLQSISEVKRDIDNAIEANELLAEHTIASRTMQSDLEREGFQSNELQPAYEKRIEELNKQVLGKAKSADVRARLEQILPLRSAARIDEVRQQADQRFKSEALAGYERVLQKNTTAYALAKTDQEREVLKNQHLGTLDVLTSRYVISPEQREKEGQRFSRQVELFDVQRMILADPSVGLDALLSPEKFLERFPNVKIDDLDNIYSNSVQAQDLQTRKLEAARKQARESIISKVDEDTIRGGMTWDKLNQLRDSQLISPEDYRRNALAMDKILDEGGKDDPSTYGQLATQIRLNPNSVSTSQILSPVNNGTLSRKGANELLDLKATWQRAHRAEVRADKALANAGNATPARLRGPLFQTAKNKIDRIIGRGMGGMLGMLDEESQRRYGQAIDLYMERTVREPNVSHQKISDEIIEMFKGPATTEDLIPPGYRNEKGKANWNKIREDYLKADPRRSDSWTD
jgi:hypothetical protein